MKSEFIFVACKSEANDFVKSEVLKLAPEWKPAFSRPGFLTFKVDGGDPDLARLNHSRFIRTLGVSIGKFAKFDSLASDLKAAVDTFTNEAGESFFQHLHFWPRNIGKNDQSIFEFFQWLHSETDDPIRTQLKAFSESNHLALNRTASSDEKVLNVIQIDEDQFAIGWHEVKLRQQKWPGGVPRFPIPESVVSRAYFKTKEAMMWSRFPFQEGDVCVELGSAPGGSVQALLDAKLEVIGIDPAVMDESIMANPNFTHMKKRNAYINKKDIADAKWLFADSNVAPQHTLDSVAEIVNNQHTSVHGLILTLKLLQDKLTGEINQYASTVKSWGFNFVRVRQLAFNRNEVCLIALKRKSLLRFGKVKSKSGKPKPNASTPNASTPNIPNPNDSKPTISKASESLANEPNVSDSNPNDSNANDPKNTD